MSLSTVTDISRAFLPLDLGINPVSEPSTTVNLTVISKWPGYVINNHNLNQVKTLTIQRFGADIFYATKTIMQFNGPNAFVDNRNEIFG
jgi:hypothetical protein